MSREEIFEKVKTLLSDITEADDITEESELMEDLDIASIDVLTLCGTLEELFGISIPEKLMRKMDSVGDIVDIVSDQIN